MSYVTYLASRDLPSGRPPRRVAREAFERLLDNLLEHGRYALHQMKSELERGSTEVRSLVEAGYLQVHGSGQVELSPMALRASEERQLLELFRPRGDALAGQHDLARPGPGPEPGDEVQPYQPGEPLDHLDLAGTLREALARGWPLTLTDDDIRVRPGPATGRCACVLLIDLSGSMERHNKFPAARRAALALRALIRSRFPGDVLVTGGFATRANLLPGARLLEARPHSVGLYDPHEAGRRLPGDAPEVPDHFTNIQAGLRLARKVLRREAHAARQILLITDGEPTAHLEGSDLVLAYPPTEATFRHTLEEARRCAAEGIALGVFGLVGEFSPPGLEPFLDRLARAGRGTSLCCSPRRLASNLVHRFLRTRSGQE
ncbi:MAG: VWA domain-containing protein [Gemmataceae bacterium]